MRAPDVAVLQTSSTLHEPIIVLLRASEGMNLHWHLPKTVGIALHVRGGMTDVQDGRVRRECLCAS